MVKALDVLHNLFLTILKADDIAAFEHALYATRAEATARESM